MQRQPHEIARARDRGLERHALCEPGRDRARERAAGAMAVRRVDPRRFPARDLAFAGFEQPVGHGLAFGMAAFDEQRTTVREHRLLAAQGFEFGQVRRRDHRAIEQGLERRDRRRVGEHRPARRDHHRIEHQRRLREVGLGKPIRHRGSGFCTPDHADLDRIDADVRRDAVDLREHHVGRHRMDALHAQRVLRGDRGDRRHRMAAEHRDRLDIGLGPRAAAAIRPGDNQNACGHGSPT